MQISIMEPRLPCRPIVVPKQPFSCQGRAELLSSAAATVAATAAAERKSSLPSRVALAECLVVARQSYFTLSSLVSHASVSLSSFSLLLFFIPALLYHHRRRRRRHPVFQKPARKLVLCFSPIPFPTYPRLTLSILNLLTSAFPSSPPPPSIHRSTHARFLTTAAAAFVCAVTTI
ncbi:hypothetical protein BDD12DRAFT_365735 [Trichophaea hybrida]|nr:hypothetical protein BDD12DRAFT_365735 [Trichophaea hybrida]